MPQFLHQPVCFSFVRISLILYGSCDHLRCGTREWILILRTRLVRLLNMERCFWSMWRTYTVPDIDVCPLLNPKEYLATISWSPQWLVHLVNHHLIYKICPEMMRNPWYLTTGLNWHWEEVITQYADWQPQCSIRFYGLNYQRTGAKIIQILTIPTPSLWRLAAYFWYRISTSSAADKSRHTQSTPITEIWHITYSLLFHMA